MNDIIDFLFVLIGIYCIVLVLVGTTGNLLTCFICLRKKLRAITTFIFLSFMVVSDTFALYIWCLDHFLEVFFNFSVEKHSIWTCRFSIFIQYVSLEWSSWLLVALSVDRWLSVQFKTWRPIYFRPTQASLLSLALLAIISILNSNLLVLSGRVDEETQILYCYTEGEYSDWILLWQKVHAFLYSLIPLFLIAMANSMLIYRTHKRPTSIEPQPEQQGNVEFRKKFAERKKMISLTILVVTSGFVISTTPSAIIMGFFVQDLYKNRIGKLVVWVFDALLFTYHSVKFEIILVFNYQFNKEFESFLTQVRAFFKTRTRSGGMRRINTGIHTKSRSITDMSV